MKIHRTPVFLKSKVDFLNIKLMCRFNFYNYKKNVQNIKIVEGLVTVVGFTVNFSIFYINSSDVLKTSQGRKGEPV